jgi:CubicO group peptidase (beta-lactamase class C family)
MHAGVKHGCQKRSQKAWHSSVCILIDLVALLLAVSSSTPTPTTIDLAAPLPISITHNANPGANALRRGKGDDILGYAVIKGGALVASEGPSSMENVWSVTKTWVATLIGILVYRGSVKEELRGRRSEG